MREFFARFLNDTSYRSLTPSPQSQGAPHPPLEDAWPEQAALIALPAGQEMAFPAAGLRETVEKRRSLRRYAPDALSLGELAGLLWLTQGVQKISKRPATLRTVPSAGARHALETIVLVNRVDGLEPGLYRYVATRHALLRLEAPEDIAARMAFACGEQEHVAQSAVTFAWYAVMERMSFRYSERSMRYIHLDAGHVCQNLYLAAEAVDCGVCAIAAFDDEGLNRLLGLDGVDRFVVYLGTVGRRPAQKEA